MNKTPLTEESLDAMFSDFFKAKMPKQWPAAPATPAFRSEPSSLAAARAAQPPVEAPRNEPVTTSRDTGSKSRYTLAASVALLLGTCWTLSNGFQPGARSTPNGTPSPVNMNPVTASDPAVLTKIKEENATKGNNKNDGFVPPVIDLGP